MTAKGSSPRPPRTPEQATALLGHYSEVAKQLADAEAGRTAEIGRINAAADAVAAPLVAELDALSARLKLWWALSGSALAPKGRKSLQLGGCMIGTRAVAVKLAHRFIDDDKAVEALRASRFGNLTTRVKYSLDRDATLKLLQAGKKAGETLAELGFSQTEPGEAFYIKRVEQAGTIEAA